MFGLSKKLLLAGAAFFFCTSAISGPYPDEAKSTRTTVTVNIVWLEDFKQVNAMCEYLSNNATVELAIVGCFDPRTMTIYAVEPHNFNDAFRLEILGHEFWHALGATHPAI